jgi:DNA polymerase IV
MSNPPFHSSPFGPRALSKGDSRSAPRDPFWPPSGVEGHPSLYCALVFEEFPACVAAAYNPLLRNRPFVVARQNGESHKSVVWSASPRARALGVCPGAPLQEIGKRYSAIEVVPYCEELHAAARDELARALERFTPEATVARNGACLLDLSGTPLARSTRPDGAARAIQKAVAAQTGLEPPAAGMASGALVARIMARGALPGAVRVCPEGREEAELAACETKVLPGLSPGCRERLRKYGLLSVGQLQRLDRTELVARFGREGERLYGLARGIDIKESSGPDVPLRAETVFDRDVNDGALLHQYLRRTIDRFCFGARRSKLAVHRLRLVIRYTDRKTAQRTIIFTNGAADYLTIARRVAAAFDALYVRRVGLKSMLLVGGRLDAESGQMELFESDGAAKQRKIGEKIAAVREEMGFDAVFTGGDYGAYVLESK